VIAAWVATAALASDEVVLRVGVDREAGVIADLAADGAAGLCVPGPSVVACPATGPVDFRWAGAEGWTLYGTTQLRPGETGYAWVLASEDTRAAEDARLDHPDLATVTDLFIRTSDNPIPVPSLGMLERLWSLADSRDPALRRVLVDAMVPWLRHTASDPLPAEAPPVIPQGLIARLSKDPDFHVRRRLAAVLREVRVTEGTPEWFGDEVHLALVRLLDDRPTVQRAAIATLSQSAWAGVVPAVSAWAEALDRVRIPGPPGRAAANTLARLSVGLKPGPDVDPSEAVGLVFEYQREKTWLVWTAWRSAVPFDRQRVDVLLRETLGISGRLLRSWADDDAPGLAAAIAGWEPVPPHSTRFEIARQALAQSSDPSLKHALELDIRPIAAGKK
jgi:hypothetical protein